MTAQSSEQRRKFLKSIALLGSAAVCLPLVKKAAAENEPVPPRPAKAPQGYRETEHISKYYQTARN